MRKGSKHCRDYRGTPLERFWSKVVRGNNCWGWSGAKKDGYGVLRISNKNVYAHRFSFYTHFGINPFRKFVCHHCDNPSCTNPEHLFLGNNYDNVKDMVSKNRHSFGEKNGQSKLFKKDVLKIRRMKEKGKYSQAQLAKFFNISETTISQIVNYSRWGYLSEKMK